MGKWLSVIIGVVAMITVASAGAFAANSATVDVTVSIAQEASISVTGGPVAFGAMKIGDSAVSTAPVTVKNNGSGASETYSLYLNNPSGWTAVITAPGVDQYRLSCAFNADNNVASWAPANYALTTSSQTATVSKFAGNETGAGVPYNADKHLYMKLETPSATTSSSAKTIQVVIVAVVD